MNERIRLEPITKEDTPLIIKWRNNENVRKNFIFQEKFTEEMHNNWLDTKVRTGEVIQFIIIINESGSKIGSVYFRDVNYAEKKAEYGIFIGEDSARGKGFGTEAARLALEKAFNEFKLKRIFLRVYEDNISAIRSYEKVGFKKNDKIELDTNNRKLIFMEIYKETN